MDEIAQVSKQRSVVDSNTGFHCSLFEEEADVGCMVIPNHATLDKLAVFVYRYRDNKHSSVRSETTRFAKGLNVICIGTELKSKEQIFEY